MQFTGHNGSLEIAIAADDPRAVRDAIAAGAQVNARGIHGVTPLIYAVGIRSKKAVEEMLKQKANPNLKDDELDSAVSLAVLHYEEDPRLLEMVMDAGGDPNLTGRDDFPVIMHFMINRNLEGVSYLHNKGANIDALVEGWPLIVNAAYAVDWDMVAHLMDLGAKLDTVQASTGLIEAFKVPGATLSDSPLYESKVRVWKRLKSLGYDPVPPDGM